MLLRALVFYLAIFPVCADTEVIEYLIPEEVMGVYQSPYAFHGIDASIGIIDSGVLGILPPYIAKTSEAPVCRGL